ncbi:MAG: HAD-IB family phosphatase [Paludibacteraceae bacterium]|nr:HAD-IB family phosphatase [Paludibacteraceae bacterium]
MKKQLYAYDFDNTLVSYDSFRRYLWHLMTIMPCAMMRLLIRRRLRLISGAELKAQVTKMVSKSELLAKDAKCFANRIAKDVEIPQITPQDATILLISASPDIYMQHIAKVLNCDVLCSKFIGTDYMEMYGDEKTKNLHQYYPETSYEYTYAASDSESDLCWMREFSKYELVKQ